MKQFEIVTLKNPTGKEMQVLRLLSQGYRVKEVARETNNSLHTIDSHLKNVRRKFGYKSTIQAVADLVKKGEI